MAALLLSACGFRPLYAHGSGGGSAVFTSVYVEPIDAEPGYELRNSLIDLMDASNRRANMRYSLKVVLHDQLQGSALQNDASITRYNYRLTADYVLTDNNTNKPVTNGQAASLTAYNVVSSPYSTLIAQKDAQKRGAEEIAERIRLDLSVYFARVR
ncbi:MAG TPA: LPS assembly lipoprotein LptE [Rhizomicrobium sp.]|nr:LPS assembly lipoprotein LptE [Rhizomicrobium sp.]